MANKEAIKQEGRMARMEQKLEDVCSDLNEIKSDLKNFIVQADKRYAPRWVADLAKALLGILTVASLGFIVWIIESYIIHIGK